MAATDLCGLEDIRSQLQKTNSDTDADQVLSQLITRASTAIVRYCDRTFTGDQDAELEFEYDGRGILSFAPYDVQAVTEVIAGADTTAPYMLAASSWRLFPQPAPDGVYPAMKLGSCTAGTVRVTGDWGWPEVPADVVQACAITVVTWYRRDVAAFSTVYKLDEGAIERPEPIPSAVRGLLRPYKRLLVG